MMVNETLSRNLQINKWQGRIERKTEREKEKERKKKKTRERKKENEREKKRKREREKKKRRKKEKKRYRDAQRKGQATLTRREIPKLIPLGGKVVSNRMKRVFIQR